VVHPLSDAVPNRLPIFRLDSDFVLSPFLSLINSGSKLRMWRRVFQRNYGYLREEIDENEVNRQQEESVVTQNAFPSEHQQQPLATTSSDENNNDGSLNNAVNDLVEEQKLEKSRRDLSEKTGNLKKSEVLKSKRQSKNKSTNRIRDRTASESIERNERAGEERPSLKGLKSVGATATASPVTRAPATHNPVFTTPVSSSPESYPGSISPAAHNQSIRFSRQRSSHKSTSSSSTPRVDASLREDPPASSSTKTLLELAVEYRARDPERRSILAPHPIPTKNMFQSPVFD